MKDIFTGLSYLHQFNIIHRDLKMGIIKIKIRKYSSEQRRCSQNSRLWIKYYI